jgi:hypothetical protein
MQHNSRPQRQPFKPTINKPTKEYNVVENLQDYMFTGNNLTRYAKDMFAINTSTSSSSSSSSSSSNNSKKSYLEPGKDKQKYKEQTNTSTNTNSNSNIYKPLKKDSLFWCFFILKYGFSKYEMEIGSQYFTVEKTEKFKYIEMLRDKANKDLMKINKIKPMSEIEDDLANKERISVKTFFALCIMEKINVLLVDNRKIYQSMNNDSPTINVIHRNSKTFENYIELNVTNSSIENYKETYYNVVGFEDGLKSMSAYKVDELYELCKKLKIELENDTKNDTKNDTNENDTKNNKKKMSKKSLYELIVQHL